MPTKLFFITGFCRYWGTSYKNEVALYKELLAKRSGYWEFKVTMQESRGTWPALLDEIL